MRNVHFAFKRRRRGEEHQDRVALTHSGLNDSMSPWTTDTHTLPKCQMKNSAGDDSALMSPITDESKVRNNIQMNSVT